MRSKGTQPGREGNRKSQNVNDKIFRIFFMMMKLKVLP